MQNMLKFIGYIDTPYDSVEECPVNIDFNGSLCKLVIDDEYKEGIKGLAVNQNILILYWLDNAKRDILLQSKGEGHNNSKEKTGTFSLRSPHRPNPIGAAVTPIVDIKVGEITVKGLDCLNGTRLLDIKPAIMRE